MPPIQNQTAALEQFRLAAIKQAAATESGDYSTGNTTYTHLMEAVKWLAAHQAIGALQPLLHAENVGIRLWTASVLLSHGLTEAEEILVALASSASIHGVTAATILSEWRAGRLHPIA